MVNIFSSTTRVQVNSQGALVLGGLGMGEQYHEHSHQVYRTMSANTLQVVRTGLLSNCPPEDALASK